MDKNGNQREEFGRAAKDFINFFENALETKDIVDLLISYGIALTLWKDGKITHTQYLLYKKLVIKILVEERYWELDFTNNEIIEESLKYLEMLCLIP